MRRQMSPPTNKNESDLWKAIQAISQLRITSIHEPVITNEISNGVIEQLTCTINSRFDALITPTQLVELSCIKEIADALSAPKQIVSMAQKRILLQESLWEQQCLYYVPIFIELRGSLNRAALNQAYAEMFKRHAVLRTTFLVSEQDVKANIKSKQHSEIHYHDIRGEYQQELREKIIRESCERSFDYTESLARALCLQEEDELHLLSFVFHHTIFDGWSIHIFLRELTAFYNAFVTNTCTPLLPVTISFNKYLSEQSTDSSLNTAAIEYWRTMLNSYTGFSWPQKMLRLNNPPGTQAETYTLHIKISDRKALDSFCQEKAISLFMLFMSVLNVLLFRYTGQNDLCIVSVDANRNESKYLQTIGMFVETLIYRTQFDTNASFDDVIIIVRDNCLAALATPKVPIEMVIENPPLYMDVALVFQNTPNLNSIDWLSLTANYCDHKVEAARFDLTINVIDGDDELKVDFVYNNSIFSADVIVNMASHFDGILQTAIKNSSRPILEANYLSQQDLSLIQAWNNTEHKLPPYNSIDEILAENAEKNPGKVAIRFGDESLTYSQLDARINHLASSLCLDENFTPGNHIGVCVKRSINMVIAVFCVLKAGGVLVPLETANDESVARNHKIQDAGITLIIDDEKIKQLTSNDTKSNFPKKKSSKALAFIPYTSGTTGKPKGVMIEHVALLNWYEICKHNVKADEQDVVFLVNPLTFDACIWEIIMALCCGGRLIINNEVERIDPLCLERLFAKQKVTTVTLTPSLLAMLEPKKFPSLRKIITTGEALNGKIITAWADVGCQIYNAYGATESTSGTISVCEKGKPVSVGLPTSNTTLYILDQNEQRVAANIMGRVFLGGKISRGYLNNKELSEKKFKNVFLDDVSHRLYDTGDTGYFTLDGHIHIVGRADNETKLQGVRVNRGIIEKYLQQHENVRVAHVLEHGDAENKKLLAFLVSTDGRNIPETELYKLLSTTSLPKAAVPRSYIFIEQIPLTSNNKVDANALLGMFASRAAVERKTVPMNEIEACIHSSWCDLFSKTDLQLDDNFFDLGGRSFQAMQLINIIRKKYSANIRIKSLYKYPTIRLLAEHICKQGKNSNLKTLSLERNFVLLSPSGSSEIYTDLSDTLSNHGRVSTVEAYDKQLVSSTEYFNLMLKEVLARLIDRPNYLVAWSSSALLTLHIASIVKQRGYDVTCVFIDALCPHILARQTELPRFTKYIEVFSRFSNDNIDINPENYFSDADIIAALHEKVCCETNRDHVTGFTNNLLTMVNMATKIVDTTTDIYTFTTVETRNQYHQDFNEKGSALGWDFLYSQVSNLMVDGDHFSILELPQCRHLVAQLIKNVTTKKELEYE